MTKDLIINTIVDRYHDEIVCYDDIVQFEETVGNFSESIMRDWSEKYMKGIFGMIFDNEDDCYYYILNDLSGLLEACQEYIWKTNKKN